MKEIKPDPNCEECKGTGTYVGLWLDVGPCRTCMVPKEAPLHRCARAARAITPTNIEPEQHEVRLNVGLQESWKKLFQKPQAPTTPAKP